MKALHIMRERDVGLFSLIQQVICNVPWALHEGRVPIADFGKRCCYWVPEGHNGEISVWEYYFEPVIAELPAAGIPAELRTRIDAAFPDQNDLGYWLDGSFVTNHYGDHPDLAHLGFAIPYETGNPSDDLRQRASRIIDQFVRPRPEILRKAEAFIETYMSDHEVIGVHVRGTDAVSAQETRSYRQGSLDLERYVGELKELLTERPEARVFVATDAQSSLQYLQHALGDRVLAYDAVRHTEGEAAGQGPTGCIMPAYIAASPEAAAQNGEDAVVEFLILRRCDHLVHNGASLATTVLLSEPHLTHTNTHVPR